MTQGCSGDEVTGPPVKAVPEFISDVLQVSAGRFCLLLRKQNLYPAFFSFLCKLSSGLFSILMFLGFCPVVLVTTRPVQVEPLL